jgi:transcriptional regulator with XRE-family HTH domain
MPDEFYLFIGSKIRELRLNRAKGEMSQDAVAEKIGVASNTVSRWETGTYKPTPEDLEKLARLFEVSITVFFPNLQHDDSAITALASATGGLSKGDLEEVLKYAEFRKARLAMENAKRKKVRK